MAKNYYHILGVSKNATPDQIKKARNQLARKFHPDVNKDKVWAEKKMKEVNEAFDILSNASKRTHYDAPKSKSRSTNHSSNYRSENYHRQAKQKNKKQREAEYQARYNYYRQEVRKAFRREQEALRIQRKYWNMGALGLLAIWMIFISIVPSISVQTPTHQPEIIHHSPQENYEIVMKYFRQRDYRQVLTHIRGRVFYKHDYPKVMYVKAWSRQHLGSSSY